jgi:hypothetical protein
VKVGDLVRHKNPAVRAKLKWPTGVVLDFPEVSHPKEFQRVRVLTADGVIESWILQFCEVVKENKA